MVCVPSRTSLALPGRPHLPCRRAFPECPRLEREFQPAASYSAWASHSNVIGTSRDSILTAVTSIVWVVATLVSCLLQLTAKRIQASTQSSALVRGLKGIRLFWG